MSVRDDYTKLAKKIYDRGPDGHDTKMQMISELAKKQEELENRIRALESARGLTKE